MEPQIHTPRRVPEGGGWGDGEEQLQPGKDRLLVCPPALTRQASTLRVRSCRFMMG